MRIKLKDVQKFTDAKAKAAFDFDDYGWGEELDKRSEAIAKIGAAVGISVAIQSIRIELFGDALSLNFWDEGNKPGVTIIASWKEVLSDLDFVEPDQKTAIIKGIRAALDKAERS